MTIADPSSHADVLWIHRKTGERYEILYHGLQEGDLSSVVIYRKWTGGPVWVRPAEEFFDGRFVPNRSYVEISTDDIPMTTEAVNDR